MIDSSWEKASVGLANEDVETPAGWLVTLLGMRGQLMQLMEYPPLFCVQSTSMEQPLNRFLPGPANLDPCKAAKLQELVRSQWVEALLTKFMLAETICTKLVESPDPSHWPNSSSSARKGYGSNVLYPFVHVKPAGTYGSSRVHSPIVFLLRDSTNLHNFTRSHWGPPGCSHPKYPRSSTGWSRGWYLEGQIQ